LDASKPLEGMIYQSLKGWVPRLDDDLPGNLYQTVIESVERPLLQLALEQTQGNQCRAAQLLGINRNTLRKKMTDLGLK
jgi:DNA-binding protein Fis